MRQLFRVTAEDFAPKEPTIPDAVMDSDDLIRLRQLAGLNETHDGRATSTYTNPGGLRSPVGSVADSEAASKRTIEAQKKIKPGSDEWFRLWFAKPHLTGEKPVGDESAGHTNSLMSVNPTTR